MATMNDEAARIVAALRDLPDEAVVRWGDDHELFIDDVHTGWVDVFHPQLCDTLGFAWVWTITGPDSPGDTRLPSTWPKSAWAAHPLPS